MIAFTGAMALSLAASPLGWVGGLQTIFDFVVTPFPGILLCAELAARPPLDDRDDRGDCRGERLAGLHRGA